MAVDDLVVIAGGLDAIDDQVVLYNQGLIIGLSDLDANNNPVNYTVNATGRTDAPFTLNNPLIHKNTPETLQ